MRWRRSVPLWLLLPVGMAQAQTPDLRATVLLISNYWPDSAAIYVQADSGYQSIGRFASGSHTPVVLSGASLGHAAVLRLIAMPRGTHLMFELEPVVRNTNGLPNMVLVNLGQAPPPKEQS